MTDSDHERLLETILYSSCKIMISSYENNLYDAHLNGWRKVKKEHYGRMFGKKDRSAVHEL